MDLELAIAQELLKNSNNGFCVIHLANEDDEQWSIQWANRALLEMSGHEELAGKPLNAIVPADFHKYHYRGGAQSMFYDRMAGPDVYYMHMPSKVVGQVIPSILIHKDGSEVPVIINVSRVVDKFAASVVDATELNKAKDEAERLRDKAERERLETVAIARVINHDLKSGMLVTNSIFEDIIEILEDADDDDTEIDESLKGELEKNAEDGSEAVQGLYALLRESTKLYHLDEEIDIRNHKPACIQKHLEKTYERFNVNWHNFDADTDVCIDTAMLANHVLANLITNALKYNNSEEKCVDITFMESTDEKFSEIHVSDNGIGIPADKIPDLLNPTLMGKKVILNNGGKGLSDSDESTGMGLYAAKKVIRAHKGNLSVKSVVGEGSTFIVSIPKPKTLKSIVANG